ncbi:MAG: PDZ domain-containing protein [Firmicutes bacterium]|nr:PDZ domain-containing protein [Bacillota bacterium]
MNDEFDFTSPQQTENSAADVQKEEPAQTAADSGTAFSAGNSAAETPAADAPAQEADAQTAPEAAQPVQETPAAPADPYPNPFAVQQPYAAYPYAPQQAGRAYPPYAPQQPNAQQIPYRAPAAPYQQPYAPQAPYAAPNAQYAAPNAPYPPYAAQPYWYAQQKAPTPPQNGAVPPAPPVAGGYSGAQPAAPAPKQKKKGGRIVLWILAALLEAVIVGFAIYGVYSLAVGNSRAPSGGQRPGYGQQLPGQPDNGGASSEAQDNSTSSAASNYTNVQLGIVCVQMKDEFWSRYNLEPGLVVQSISSDSNAQNTDLQQGDVITAANGTKVQTFDDLFAVMDKMSPGDEMTLTVYRPSTTQDGYAQGESFTVTFAVKEKSDSVSSDSASDYPQA